MKTALLLIDIQNDYFPGGCNELAHPCKAARQAAKLLSFFRRQGLPVIHVRHINTRKGAAFFLPGTFGAEIHSIVAPEQGELVLIKHTPDSFYETTLKIELDRLQVGTLVVAGMMTHMCVDTTVRTARNFGYTIDLVKDACATKELCWDENRIPAQTVQEVYLASLQGSFAQVISADEWLLGRAELGKQVSRIYIW